jgi:hypothetical protein
VLTVDESREQTAAIHAAQRAKRTLAGLNLGVGSRLMTLTEVRCYACNTYVWGGVLRLLLEIGGEADRPVLGHWRLRVH